MYLFICFNKRSLSFYNVKPNETKQQLKQNVFFSLYESDKVFSE